MEIFGHIVGEHGFRKAGAFVLEDITAVTDGEIRSLLPLLPAWRREKTLGLRSLERRRESVLSFLLLARLLRNDYGISDPIEFDYGAHGKPLLRNRPDVHFNMSHCKVAVACIAGGNPVGIDIERRGRYKALLAEKVLSDGELASLRSAADPDLAFTELWTRKEAILKLTGEGIGGEMKNVISDSSGITLSSFVRDGYVCSVASFSEPPV